MKKSIFMQAFPFCCVGLCFYSLYFEYFVFAGVFLLAAFIVVLLEYSLFINEQKK